MVAALPSFTSYQFECLNVIVFWREFVLRKNWMGVGWATLWNGCILTFGRWWLCVLLFTFVGSSAQWHRAFRMSVWMWDCGGVAAGPCVTLMHDAWADMPLLGCFARRNYLNTLVSSRKATSIKSLCADPIQQVLVPVSLPAKMHSTRTAPRSSQAQWVIWQMVHLEIISAMTYEFSLQGKFDSNCLTLRQ